MNLYVGKRIYSIKNGIGSIVSLNEHEVEIDYGKEAMRPNIAKHDRAWFENDCTRLQEEIGPAGCKIIKELIRKYEEEAYAAPHNKKQ